MMIFSIAEIVDILIMTLVLGFIFKDVFLPRAAKVMARDDYDPLAHYKRGRSVRVAGAGGMGGLISNGFVFAMIVTAPAVILHELGHKLIAMSYGMTAEFHAAYFWLAIGAVLKLMNFGFIFFVPAYVSITGAGLTQLQSAAIAFAGPGVNLLLWVLPFLLLKNKNAVKWMMQKNRALLPILKLTATVNIFLFIFNMLPIPGFDGFKVYSGLIKGVFF